MKAILAVIFAIAVNAQTPPAFETARVSPWPDARGCSIRYLPDTFCVTWCPLAVVVRRVYDLRDFQIMDAPKWFSDQGDGFSIAAKAPGPVDEGQLKLMARQLLADRFQLRTHRETREMPVYALAVGRGGPKGIATSSGQRRGSDAVSATGVGWLEGINISMPTLAAAISVDRLVIDKTNFSGAIDLNLRYAGQSIFAVIEQELGLVLRPETDPIEVLVIDNAEQPSAS